VQQQEQKQNAGILRFAQNDDGTGSGGSKNNINRKNKSRSSAFGEG
jgi:hypothetical protein